MPLQNQFTIPFVSTRKWLYIKTEGGIFCKMGRNGGIIWQGKGCLGGYKCCCRQDVAQRRLKVAVAN